MKKVEKSWFSVDNKNDVTNYYNASLQEKRSIEFIAHVTKDQGYVMSKSNLFKFRLIEGEIKFQKRLSKREYHNVFHFEVKSDHLFILFSPDSQNFEECFHTTKPSSLMLKSKEKSKKNQNLYLDIFFNFQRVSSDIAITGPQNLEPSLVKKNSSELISAKKFEEKGKIHNPLQELSSYNESNLFFEVITSRKTGIPYLALNRILDREIKFFQLNGLGSIYVNKIKYEQFDNKLEEILESRSRIDQENGIVRIQNLKKNSIPKKIKNNLYRRTDFDEVKDVVFINNWMDEKFAVLRSDGILAFLEISSKSGFEKFEISQVIKIDFQSLAISKIFSTVFMENYFFLSYEKSEEESQNSKREYGLLSFYINSFHELSLNHDTLLGKSDKCNFFLS